MASSLSILWLGHSTFIIGTPAGPRVLIDPWLGNPMCPQAYAKPEATLPLDAILVTHGHPDHMSDLVAVARAADAPIVCPFEMGRYLEGKGVQHVCDMGVGGTQDVAGLKVTMTAAVHSGGFVEEGRVIYMGVACGYILRQDGMPTIYFAGDTALFGDMKLIAELYKPEIAFLPVGDHYTMGPDTAAIAAKWLGVRQVVPMHFGTFPVLWGTPEALREHLAGTDIEILTLQPGETAT
jgi:L-ascorbate metabolism protein UlaG (beta-lactamase superfamily)